MQRQALHNLLHAGIVEIDARRVREALDRGGAELLAGVLPDNPYLHAMMDCSRFSALSDQFKTRAAYNEEQARVFRALTDYGADPLGEYELDETGIKLRIVDLAWINMVSDYDVTENEDGDPVAGNPEASAELVLAALCREPGYVPDIYASTALLRLTPKQQDMDRTIELARCYMEQVQQRVAERLKEYHSDDLSARVAFDLMEIHHKDNLMKWLNCGWDIRGVQPWILPESYDEHIRADTALFRTQMKAEKGLAYFSDVQDAARKDGDARVRMTTDILLQRLTGNGKPGDPKPS